MLFLSNYDAWEGIEHSLEKQNDTTAVGLRTIKLTDWPTWITMWDPPFRFICRSSGSFVATGHGDGTYSFVQAPDKHNFVLVYWLELMQLFSLR